MTRLFILCALVLVVACLSYLGYKEYQQHIEFKAFMAEVDSLAAAELFPPKVVPRRTSPAPVTDLNTAASFINHQKPGRTITTASGEKIKLSLSAFEIGKEIIRILPNGEMYAIHAPEGSLDNPEAWDIKPFTGTLGRLPAAEYPQGDTSPIDYHVDDVPTGEDPYIYGVKLMKAQTMGISLEQFEQKLASREIIIGSSYRVPLTAQAGSQEETPAFDRYVEPSEIAGEDNSPQSGRDKALGGLSHSEVDSGSDGNISHDTDPGQELTNAPFLGDSPDMAESTPSTQSIAELENQLTPQGIELDGGLSTDPADKAQQLIDQYGTEEGLRRLRGSDPEAAERFDRERRLSRDAPKREGYSDESPPEDAVDSP